MDEKDRPDRTWSRTMRTCRSTRPLPVGRVGRQNVDVEVVVAGEPDRLRMQRHGLARSDVASDDCLGPVVDDRHRDAAEMGEGPAVAVEEALQVLAGGETAERIARVRQRHVE